LKKGKKLTCFFLIAKHVGPCNRYRSHYSLENPGLTSLLVALKNCDPFLKKNIVYFFKKKLDANKKD